MSKTALRAFWVHQKTSYSEIVLEKCSYALSQDNWKKGRIASTTLKWNGKELSLQTQEALKIFEDEHLSVNSEISQSSYRQLRWRILPKNLCIEFPNQRKLMIKKCEAKGFLPFPKSIPLLAALAIHFLSGFAVLLPLGLDSSPRAFNLAAPADLSKVEVRLAALVPSAGSRNKSSAGSPPQSQDHQLLSQWSLRKVKAPTPSPTRQKTSSPQEIVDWKDFHLASKGENSPFNLSVEELQKIIYKRQRSFQECYESSLIKEPSLAGQTELIISVAASGTVENLRLLQFPSKNSQTQQHFSDCLLQNLKSLELPLSATGFDLRYRLLLGRL
jgi:hypothetical protein